MGPRPSHHFAEDVGVEHPVHRDSFGGRRQTCYGPHGVYQCLPVVRAAAAQQRTIDIEQQENV